MSRIEQTTANETYDQPKTDLHKYIFIYECVFSYERLEYGKRSILWELFKDFTMNITHACNIVHVKTCYITVYKRFAKLKRKYYNN